MYSRADIGYRHGPQSATHRSMRSTPVLPSDDTLARLLRLLAPRVTPIRPDSAIIIRCSYPVMGIERWHVRGRRG